ncbi:MAG: glycosyltransferase family 2 protein [Pseudomonadota bacterium]
MADPMPTISVAIAVHNRKAATLACLRSLWRQDGANEDFALRVTVLDDASTDGTRDAVADAFPEVELLDGSGSLFWGGGMNVAMTRALEGDPDFALLLNDDVTLRADAIRSALETYRALADAHGERLAVVGATVEPGTETVTYSGFLRTSRRDPSKVARIETRSAAPQPCDTMNGNFVLLPRVVTRALGPIDGTFIHQLGDLDYGYRLTKHGGTVWIAPGDIGECAANPRKMPFERPGLSVKEKWRALNTPLGMPPRSWVTFMYRHGGLIGLVILAGIYAKKMVR